MRPFHYLQYRNDHHKWFSCLRHDSSTEQRCRHLQQSVDGCGAAVRPGLQINLASAYSFDHFKKLPLSTRMSGDRFSERRFVAAMKDASAVSVSASQSPASQPTIDISSLLSLYNDDDDDVDSKFDEDNRNEGGPVIDEPPKPHEGISALKFLNYKSVLSVPALCDGQEHSEDSTLLPRSTSSAAEDKKPIFDIFADDDASTPVPSPNLPGQGLSPQQVDDDVRAGSMTEK